MATSATGYQLTDKITPHWQEIIISRQKQKGFQNGTATFTYVVMPHLIHI